MPLESCMILLDNSEYMRNGDYVPTRLDAQQDAANLLVGTKTQSHPESTVGVSAGTELLVSPTEDVGKILNALHGIPYKAKANDVTASVQVASLALKHRKNKNGAQRIVLFVGTPLDGVEVRALAKVGRSLKKNNVSIDVVAMGELEVNEPKLKELVDAANGRTEEGAERTCHLVTIPPGVLPSDVLAGSPIVHGGAGGSAFAAAAAAAAATGGMGGGGDMGAGSFAEFGGVDPNMDPELAMALRVSMEEERARQERVAAQQAAAASASAEAEEAKDEEMSDAAAVAGGASASESAADAAAAAAMDMGLSEEEALLQQALAMSMNENDPAPPGASDANQEEIKPAAAASAAMDEDDEEAAAMQMALQMSMQAEQDLAKEGEGQQFQDPQFVNQLLGSLPGVDQSDPAIQSALQNLNQQGDKKEDDKKEDAEKKG